MRLHKSFSIDLLSLIRPFVNTVSIGSPTVLGETLLVNISFVSQLLEMLHK